MISTEVIIVGAGPAGTACAWKLKQSGVDCILLDRARFPRDKPCAGWITPEVFHLLETSPADYPGALTRFDAIHIHVKRVPIRAKGAQYAVRRIEFDDWMLHRAHVPIHHHDVRTIRKTPGAFIIDETFSAKYLVGAGGTSCPVYRRFFQSIRPRNRNRLITSLVKEFKASPADKPCKLWFFDQNIRGYSWFVPKKNGFVNIGLGSAYILKKNTVCRIKNLWKPFLQRLVREGYIASTDIRPDGWFYFLGGDGTPCARDRCFIIGDAAGLATLDMGEGIRPAVHSGILTAQAIAGGEPPDFTNISLFSDVLPFFRMPGLRGLLHRFVSGFSA